MRSGLYRFNSKKEEFLFNFIAAHVTEQELQTLITNKSATFLILLIRC